MNTDARLLQGDGELRSARWEREPVTSRQQETLLGSWEHDPTTDRLTLLAGSEEVLGLCPGTFDGRWDTFLSLLHDEDRGAVEAAVQRALTSGLPYELEFRLTGADGVLRWVNERGLVLRDARGQPVRRVSVLQEVTERRQAEQETEEDLRRSEARYRSLVDNLPAVIYTTHPDDPTQVTQYLSPHIERLLGVPAGEYLRDPAFWAHHLHPEDRDWVLEAAARSTATREPFVHEYRLVARDGATVWVRDEGRWVHDEQHRVNCLQGVMLDITNLKQAEQTLRDSEERLRLLTEVMPQLVWTGLPDGYIDFCNQRWRSYTGLTQEQIQGEGWGLALHPDDRPRVFAAWQDAVARGGDLEVEERLRGADGRYRWFLARATPLRNEAGHIVKWYGTCTDIQDRREVEEALRHSEERWQTILHATQDGVWEWDFQTSRLTWSPRLKAMLGYQDDELHVDSELVASLVHPAERARARERILQHRRGETSFYSDELRMRHRDGSYRWLLSRGLCLRDATGTALRMLGTCTDITEHKRTEEVLKEADRRKDEFLAMLAHELRNPLAPILNAVHVLRLVGPPDETTQKAEDMIERQVTHLARLVDDLLDVSRITRGKILLRMEQIDLVPLVHAAVEDHRRLLENAGLALTVELPEGPLWVLGDPTRLSQVVGNLLQNANKFTDAGGHVTVRLAVECEIGTMPRLEPSSRAARARLSIKDTGIGMEPEILCRLFEPFSQADRSLARSRGGLGLGLALVKGLVELHGGRVEAASPGPGQGSEFTIHLPLTGARAAPKKSDATAPSARHSLGVLVIEDNQDVAESLRTVLELFGYRVAVAYTGRAGVETFQQFLPDVVLCDIGLPGGMDGYAVARALRKVPIARPVRLIAVSGYGQEEDQRRALQAGFDQHLTKPIDPALLRQLLESLEPAGA